MDIRETAEYKNLGFKVVTCPICKNETLDSWEYDNTKDENTMSSANGMTIKDYRAAYLKSKI